MMLENRKGLLMYDEHIYPEMWGFKDRWDYYRAVTLAGTLHKIKVPVLTISALDDSLFDPKVIPVKECQAHDSNVIVLVTKRGNHVCHIAGDLIPRQWFTEPSMRFLDFIEAKHSFKLE